MHSLFFIVLTHLDLPMPQTQPNADTVIYLFIIFSALIFYVYGAEKILNMKQHKICTRILILCVNFNFSARGLP